MILVVLWGATSRPIASGMIAGATLLLCLMVAVLMALWLLTRRSRVTLLIHLWLDMYRKTSPRVAEFLAEEVPAGRHPTIMAWIIARRMWKADYERCLRGGVQELQENGGAMPLSKQILAMSEGASHMERLDRKNELDRETEMLVILMYVSSKHVDDKAFWAGLRGLR